MFKQLFLNYNVVTLLHSKRGRFLIIESMPVIGCRHNGVHSLKENEYNLGECINVNLSLVTAKVFE